MILQALHDYYQRKCAAPDPAGRLPAYGLEEKEIPFILEITPAGELVQLRDTRTPDGKKKVGRRYLVPQGVKKTSGVAANLLWDSLEYVVGVDTRGKPERVAEQHAAFRIRITELPESAQADPGLLAVSRFLDRLDVAVLEQEPAFAEAKEANALVSFQLHGDTELICQRATVRAAAMANVDRGQNGTPSARCLITGEAGDPERLHASIKGVWGAQTSGANIVSFNLDAFNSYAKSQGDNAPVGKSAAFAYTTALNHLLAKGSRNRFQVGDASTVCWAEQDTEFDPVMAEIFGQHDDPDEGIQAVATLFDAVKSGRFDGTEGSIRYFVLGLAPNAARISVRFFHNLTLAELAPRILQHFKDLAVARGPKDPEYPSLFRLLTACAVQGKADNVPPNLGGGILDAILAGPDAPYPSLWLNAAVNRCRAERNVGYFRAAAIKACLNRTIRRNQNEKEFLPMLDPSNTHVAYRLGRLFAALEKIQEEASPGLNATIRDRYYGAASSTPVTVFTTLLRLKNAHLKKLVAGRVVQFERLLGDILGEVANFPAHLPLPDQGRFALGYYHQRQAFFTKSNQSEPTEEND